MPRKLSTSRAFCHGRVWIHSEPPTAPRAAQQHPVCTREAAWHGESVTAKVTPAQRDLLPPLFTSRSIRRWPRHSRCDRHEGQPGAVLVLLGRAGSARAVHGRTPHHGSCSGSGSQLCLPWHQGHLEKSGGTSSAPPGHCGGHRAGEAPLQTPQQPLHLTSAFSYPGADRLCRTFSFSPPQ